MQAAQCAVCMRTVGCNGKQHLAVVSCVKSRFPFILYLTVNYFDDEEVVLSWKSKTRCERSLNAVVDANTATDITTEGATDITADAHTSADTTASTDARGRGSECCSGGQSWWRWWR